MGIIGSFGTLEIAVHNGDAAVKLGADIGEPVKVLAR